jgi:hypothetical protein
VIVLTAPAAEVLVGCLLIITEFHGISTHQPVPQKDRFISENSFKLHLQYIQQNIFLSTGTRGKVRRSCAFSVEIMYVWSFASTYPVSSIMF